MGLLNESRREFIAAPDTSKGQIVFKWPDDNIRKFARAIVEPDAQAVFMSQGKVMGVLPPGQHTARCLGAALPRHVHRLGFGRERLQGRALLRRHRASTRMCASAADWTTSRTPCPA